MALRNWINRILSTSAKPVRPAQSVTDPVVEEARRNKVAKDAFDIEVEIEVAIGTSPGGESP